MQEIKENETDFSVPKSKNLIQKILRITGELITLSKEDNSLEEELGKAEKEAQLIQKRDSVKKEFEGIFKDLSLRKKEEIIDYLFLESAKLAKKEDILNDITSEAVFFFK